VRGKWQARACREQHLSDRQPQQQSEPQGHGPPLARTIGGQHQEGDYAPHMVSTVGHNFEQVAIEIEKIYAVMIAPVDWFRTFDPG
jgi:hypothetical protein